MRRKLWELRARGRRNLGQAGEKMASAMGIFDRFFSSSDKSALEALAELAGRKEALIDRLGRHAAVCAYPNIRTGIEGIAARQAEGFKVLREILAERETWPRPPSSTPREGSNNWERLSGDLELLRHIAVEGQKQEGVWEGIDSAIAAKLHTVALADNEAESELRKLALKCDPQALD